VDEVLGDLRHTRLIGGTKGSHLIAPLFPGAPSAGVYVEAGTDARPLFILPWNGLLLVGTTDERVNEPSAVIDARELEYLATETERVFPAAAGLESRVLYTYTGVRPLPFQRRGAEGSITRRHLIRRHRAARGLYSIVGGKLTTHRALAEDVLGVLRGQLSGLERIRPTRNRPLPGSLAPKERDELLADVGAQLGIEQATRLWHVYGGAARRIAELAREDAELAVVLGGSSVLVAELAHSWNAEWASTLDDFLQRRCMAGLDADFALGAAEPAASWMVRLGIADAARAKSELEDYRALAARRCAPRAG